MRSIYLFIYSLPHSTVKMGSDQTIVWCWDTFWVKPQQYFLSYNFHKILLIYWGLWTGNLLKSFVILFFFFFSTFFLFFFPPLFLFPFLFLFLFYFFLFIFSPLFLSIFLNDIYKTTTKNLFPSVCGWENIQLLLYFLFFLDAFTQSNCIGVYNIFLNVHNIYLIITLMKRK